MNVDKVLIEHWPRLQCANFFILFTKHFIDVTSVKIKLLNSEIFLEYEGKHIVIDLPAHFLLKTDSISLLIIKSNYLSFRINTNNGDAFSVEFLRAISIKEDNEVLKLQPNINTKQLLNIVCDTCTGPLSEVIQFRRILELPSENLDLNEWFCHKHHQSTENNKTPDIVMSTGKFNFTKFIACPMDLLYGQFFFLLNSTQLINITVRNQCIYCKRCLRSLGEFQIRAETAKIWNENVLFQLADANKTKFHLFDKSLCENFLFIVQKVIQDFDFMRSSTGLPQTIKILFETSTEASTFKYLMIQVMNKNVEMYKQEQILAERLTLIKIQSLKILFCALPYTDSGSNQRIPSITLWQNDPTVNHIKISVKMMENAVAKLFENSNLVPECYRSSGNGFMLSYLYVP